MGSNVLSNCHELLHATNGTSLPSQSPTLDMTPYGTRLYLEITKVILVGAPFFAGCPERPDRMFWLCFWSLVVFQLPFLQCFVQLPYCHPAPRSLKIYNSECLNSKRVNLRAF